MQIKDLQMNNLLSYAEQNSKYNSDDWFLYIKNSLATWMLRTSGRRELFCWISDADDPTDYAARDIDVLLDYNAYKYRHLWELYVAKYNPVWNVDGTESETITRQKKTERDLNRANTGTQTNTASGEDTLKNGKIVTESGTTYDSGTLLTRSQLANTGDDVTEYGRKDTREDDLNEKTDDDSKEDETITTTKTRGGNIGVTKTTDMETDELVWSGTFKFLEELTADICSFISYSFM